MTDLDKAYNQFLKDEHVPEELVSKIRKAMCLYGKYTSRNTRHRACEIIMGYDNDTEIVGRIMNIRWEKVKGSN